MTATVRRGAVVTAAMVLATFISGCGRPTVSAPTTAPATAPATSTAGAVVSNPTSSLEPSPGATGCWSISSFASAPPPTTDVMRGVDVIGPGTVDRIDPAVWNTPGNVRPVEDPTRAPPFPVIWRPVHLTLEAGWKGTLSNDTQTVVRGGTVGCDSYTTDDDPNLVEGGRFVLFLFEITDPNGSYARIMNVVEAWPIQSDGTVVRPVEEPIDLGKLKPLLADPQP